MSTRLSKGGRLIDRSKADLWNHPDIRLLFPDRTAEGVRYYNQTGIYPINHGMAIKRSTLKRNPGVMGRVTDAFERANAKIDRERMEQLAYHIET